MRISYTRLNQDDNAAVVMAFLMVKALATKSGSRPPAHCYPRDESKSTRSSWITINSAEVLLDSGWLMVGAFNIPKLTII